MLLYHNHSFLRLLCTRQGSIFWRADVFCLALLLACLSFVFQYLVEHGSAYAPDFPNHYGIHAVGTVVGFAVVFRTSLAWNRYWEAVTQLHIMYSKWSDCYAQLVAFSATAIERGMKRGADAPWEKIDRLENFMSEMTGYFSLMSALAADRLTKGDCERMAKRATVAGWSTQIILRRQLHAEDVTGVTRLPEFRVVDDADPSFVSYAAQAHATNEFGSTKYPVKWVKTDGEVEALEPSKDRPGMVMYWILHELSAISPDLDIAPPIQSRMYQELSNGMLGFNQSVKLADVPFPMPFAQILAATLVVFCAFIPAYIVKFTNSYFVGGMMTFLVVQGLWGFNELAIELENPFGPDANDLSLLDFHVRFMDNITEIDGARQAKERFLRRQLGLAIPQRESSEKVAFATDSRLATARISAPVRADSVTTSVLKPLPPESLVRPADELMLPVRPVTLLEGQLLPDPPSPPPRVPAIPRLQPQPMRETKVSNAHLNANAGGAGGPNKVAIDHNASGPGNKGVVSSEQARLSQRLKSRGT